MARKKLELKNWKPEEILETIDNDENFKLGIKLYAIYLISTGKSTRDVEKLFQKHYSFKQISNWVHKFELAGIDGLISKPKTGRNSKLTKEQKEDLKNILLNKSPENFGYHSKKWTGALLIELIKNHFQIEYKKAQVYNLINSFGIESL